jgi:hypothetical protein
LAGAGGVIRGAAIRGVPGVVGAYAGGGVFGGGMLGAAVFGGG